MPEVILTTLGADELVGRAGKTGEAGCEAYPGVIAEEFLYRVVSPVELEDKMIHELLGAAEGDSDAVSWIYKHEVTTHSYILQ